MQSVIKISLLVAVFASLSLPPPTVFAADYYIAQTAAGAGNGTDCADAYDYTWFNTEGNWNSGPGTINPGDTVHLCGTIANALTVQASGTSGNPITIRFEQGASIQMPSCPSQQSHPAGCLDTNSQTWIVVDGDYTGNTPCGWVNGQSVACNGLIQNTLAGTSGGSCPGGTCTGVAWTNGINATGCNNCEIKNLTIANMYVRTSTSDNSEPWNVDSCAVLSGTGASFHNSICHDASGGVQLSYAGTDKFTIYQNEFYHNSHNLVFSGGGTNAAGSVYFHDNYVHFAGSDGISPWDNCPSCPDDGYHQSGIHAYGVGISGNWPSVNQFWIYNNRMDGPGN